MISFWISSKLKQLQQAQTIVTNTIICTNCGGAGHLGKDCKQQRPGDTFRMMQQETPSDKAKMDSEVMNSIQNSKTQRKILEFRIADCKFLNEKGVTMALKESAKASSEVFLLASSWEMKT